MCCGRERLMFGKDVVEVQDMLNRQLTAQVELAQVFPPVEIVPARDARICPKCGYKLQTGDWPFCDRGRHGQVQTGVGHPVVCKW